jgi:hypothetical protein
MILPQDSDSGYEIPSPSHPKPSGPTEGPPARTRTALSIGAVLEWGYVCSTCALKASIISSIGSAMTWMLVQ